MSNEITPIGLPTESTPSTERLGSTFEQLMLRNEIVAHIMRAGGTAEDCAVALDANNDKLVKRLMTLEGTAPRRIKLPDGRVMVWRCPEHLIPETDLSNTAGDRTMSPLVRLYNAIKDAVTEMDRCPGDSIQDIWNEMLDKWETGLRMDHNHNIDPNT